MSSYVPNDGIEEAGDMEAFEGFKGRQGVIYLIDAGKYEDYPKKSIVENDERFRLCLDCVEADMLNIILNKPKCLVSVVFYNTVHSPKPNALFVDDDSIATLVPPNCALFIPMKPITMQLIQYFKNFKESVDLFNFKGDYGSSNGSSFSEALWLCSRLILQSNYKLVSSEIILATNNELPHPDHSREQDNAFERAKDLCANNVTIYMLPIDTGNEDEFDVEPFYKEFISKVHGIEEEQFQCFVPDDQRCRLINREQRSNHKTSCLRHLNFELADGLAMACNVYSLTKTARKPATVKMLRENKEIVVGKRIHYVDQLNGIEDQNPNEDIEMQPRVLPGDLYKSQVVCGKEITFAPDDYIKMKCMQTPGLRLVGFKPLKELKERWMTKHCLFLYPNETKINGSTQLFRSLWQKCLEKEKYALCTLIVRRATLPKYVALVATNNVNENNGHIDGFYVIHLPTETNVSDLDNYLIPLPTPKPSQIDVMEQLCKKLRFKYRSDYFSNPSLSSFNLALEAAVYEEEIQQLEDVTLPQDSVLDEKISGFLDDIDEEFGTDPEAAASYGKRGNAGTGDGGRSKASKKDLTPNDIEQAIRNDQAGSVTVQHLKDFLQSKNVRYASSATKKALFEEAQKHCN